MNCPHCREELPGNQTAESCPLCGGRLPARPEPAPAGVTSPTKARYRTIFWLAFLGSPFLCLLGLSARLNGILVLPILGAAIAGFSLAKVYAKTPAGWIATGILLAFGVLLIYAGILFIGCLVVMGARGR